MEYACKWKRNLEDEGTAIDKVSISRIHHFGEICAYLPAICEQYVNSWHESGDVILQKDLTDTSSEDIIVGNCCFVTK